MALVCLMVQSFTRAIYLPKDTYVSLHLDPSQRPQVLASQASTSDVLSACQRLGMRSGQAGALDMGGSLEGATSGSCFWHFLGGLKGKPKGTL